MSFGWVQEEDFSLWSLSEVSGKRLIGKSEITQKQSDLYYGDRRRFANIKDIGHLFISDGFIKIKED